MIISALFVADDGPYFGLGGVDPWGKDLDARLYSGPNPVVAHPPCQRWGKMWAGSPYWIKKTGMRKKKGDDGGCFASALASVRKFGGVLEHPMGSHAWQHFGIAKPPRSGGWVPADEFGGWTCCVEQGRYGHYAPKPTWLYAVGCVLPDLQWGVHKVSESDFPDWALDRYGAEKCRRAGLLSFRGGGTDSAPRIHTPRDFAEILIEMARSATVAKKNLHSPHC